MRRESRVRRHRARPEGDLPVGSGDRQVDLGQHVVRDAIEDVVLAGHVVIQGHGLDAERLAELAHRERLDPALVGESDSGPQHQVLSERGCAGNADLVASLGADYVVDYAKEDFTRSAQRYDALVDIAGSRTLSECRRVLTPSGVLVGIGAPSKGRWIGPMRRFATMALVSPVVSQKMTFFMAERSSDDLAILADLVETGKVTPVIDRTYPLSEVPQAFRYLETGHARAKIVITI